MKHSKTATPATPEYARQCAARARQAKTIGIVSLLTLIVLGLVWELVLAPLRPGGTMLALKVLPLFGAVRGFIAGKRYTFQWMSLFVWVYFTEGIVRATSDKGMSSTLGWIETALTMTLFFACAIYARMTETSRQTA